MSAREHIQIQREELQELMKMAAALTAGKSVLPILRLVKIEAEECVLTLEATDLDNHLTLRRTLADPPLAPSPALCVSPRLLFHWLSFESAQEVALVPDPKGELIVRAGSSILRLLALDGKEMPPPPGLEGTINAACVPEGELLAALQSLAGFMSQDDTRYVLNGIHIFTKGGDLFLDATDGKVLARRRLGAVDDDLDGILARSTVALLLKLLDKEGEDDVGISVAKAGVSFRAARFELRAKLIEGTFPNVDQVMPAVGHAPERRIDAHALQSLVRQVATLTNKHGLVSLEFEDKEVTAKANAADVGRAEASAPITSASGAKAVTWVANAEYLELLGGAEGEEIIIELTTPEAPGLFRRGKEWRAVIMPMRTTA